MVLAVRRKIKATGQPACRRHSALLRGILVMENHVASRDMRFAILVVVRQFYV